MKLKTKLLIGFLSVSAVIIVAGILGIAEIRMLYTVSKEVGLKNAPLADAVMEVKLTATTAHLWVEEIISGAEEKEVIAEVWKLLDDSLWYCEAILKGGKNAEGTFYAVNDNAIEAKIISVKDDIEEFITLAKLRFENHFGTKELEDQALDDKFDAVFDKFITNADEAEEMLHAKIAQDAQQMEKSVTTSTLILGIATLVSFILASIAIYYLSRDIIKQVGGEPIQIAEITEQVAKGNLDLQFESSGKTATGIYASVQIMVKNLQKLTDDRTKQDWIKTGKTQLNEKLRGEQNTMTLAKKTIDFLTTYLEAQVGLFYLVNRAEQLPYLHRIASYAYTPSENIPDKFFIGEGLIGQAALEQKMLYRTHTPEEYNYIIQSGLSKAVPSHVLLVPFLYENAVLGVIEIGSSRALTKIQQEFIEQVMPTIGIAVNTAQSRQQMLELLQQTQAQSEELQRQTEELQSQQTALQQSNEELQSQSEELQTQQEELRHANEELEERTCDLERQKEAILEKNIALEKSQQAIETKAKELELASQYKSEFLANMSHELRTPLNSLLILAQLLKDNTEGNLTDKQVEYARTIYTAGTDLLTLINDILDLSKVEAGKMEIHVEDMPLAVLVEAVEQKFRPVAQEKGLDFDITVADDLPPVLRTDAQRLQQIINNLLSNAFKFTDKGEIKLDINSKSPQPPFAKGKFLAFSVADTGIGIPQEKQDVIFKAFQQADGSTSRCYGGTGLGLSISRQLAQLLGGELQLESEAGKGSIFTLYLPLNGPNRNLVSSKNGVSPESRNQVVSTTGVSLQSRNQVVSTVSQEESRNQVVSTNGVSQQSRNQVVSTVSQQSRNQVVSKNGVSQDDTTHEKITDDRDNLQPSDKSILVIEDDRQFSGILMQLARERDFKCLVAEDGKTGLFLAEEYQPHAIILDVRLPQLDGWSVMERLKDNPQTRHIPVHFMSASDLTRDAKKMGAIGYSLKPVNLAELSEAFKKIQQFITKTLKKILLVVDNGSRFEEILDIVGGEEVQTLLAETLTQATSHLNKVAFDCIVVEIDVENGAGIKLLEQFCHQENFSQIPVILYAHRELTSAEIKLLQQCDEHITVKAVRSQERLLDETTLFLHQVEANLSQEKRKMLQMVHDKEAILRHKKVLIVDDDMRNIFALATVLEDKDMEVLIAGNGKEALEFLDNHPDTHLVLMDIMMPEMDGHEAMQKIRAQERFCKLPIIALTAKAMKGDKAKCIEAGANDYLSKPVDTDKLISLMRVWLYQ